MGNLVARKALVLGGSRGIGAAIVRRLSEEGASVAFTYKSSREAAEELARGTKAEALQADSADRDTLIATIANRGPLDIIVINAGTLVVGNPLELDPNAIDHMIDVNVRAPYHAAVEAARQMNDDGRIIVIGSVNADRMPSAGGAAYSLTKAAMQGMVRGLAHDFGTRRITVNCIQPGPTDTDMNPADGPVADIVHGLMAIKRHVRSEEVAELVAYLAGPFAGMITGSMQTIDGGFSA
jgi:cyclic-di-GMP-binding biofilm dispersal mediator protein